VALSHSAQSAANQWDHDVVRICRLEKTLQRVRQDVRYPASHHGCCGRGCRAMAFGWRWSPIGAGVGAEEHGESSVQGGVIIGPGADRAADEIEVLWKQRTPSWWSVSRCWRLRR